MLTYPCSIQLLCPIRIRDSPRNASATVRDLRTKHLATEPQGWFCLARSVFCWPKIGILKNPWKFYPVLVIGRDYRTPKGYIHGKKNLPIGWLYANPRPPLNLKNLLKKQSFYMTQIFLLNHDSRILKANRISVFFSTLWTEPWKNPAGYFPLNPGFLIGILINGSWNNPYITG